MPRKYVVYDYGEDDSGCGVLVLLAIGCFFLRGWWEVIGPWVVVAVALSVVGFVVSLFSRES
jgi:hypothetical protein